MDYEQNLSSYIINENGDLFGTHDEDLNAYPTDVNIPFADIGHSIEDKRSIFQGDPSIGFAMEKYRSSKCL
jgi:hypothetical protein